MIRKSTQKELRKIFNSPRRIIWRNRIYASLHVILSFVSFRLPWWTLTPEAKSFNGALAVPAFWLSGCFFTCAIWMLIASFQVKVLVEFCIPKEPNQP
jgi:hypothetical protein